MNEKELLLKKVNSKVLILDWLMFVLLMGGYISELSKGKSSYTIVFTVMTMFIVPLIVASVIYFKNNLSRYIRVITAIGFFCGYAFALFNAESVIRIYGFALPLICIYCLYFEKRFLYITGGLTVAVNIAVIVTNMIQGHTSASATTDYTSQFCIILMYIAAAVITVKISSDMKEDIETKTELIMEEQIRQKALNEDILRIARIMDDNSIGIEQIVDKILNTSKSMSAAVNEIASGAMNTAQDIQEQSKLVDEIQNKIMNTAKMSEEMDEASNTNIKELNISKDVILQLNTKTKLVTENNTQVSEIMNKLKAKSNDISEIMGVITDISEQTNLLALNASIEAARAGEVGKGFAVVADEIRKLAEQTQNSANSISEIINELQTETNKSVKAVMSLKESNGQQELLISKTENSFNDISKNTNEVKVKIDGVNSNISEILKSNERIVTAISNISAVSEETTANSQEAESMTQVYIDQANEAKKLVEGLIKASSDLKKYI